MEEYGKEERKENILYMNFGRKRKEENYSLKQARFEPFQNGVRTLRY